jgi:hypothetical protein
MGDLPLNLTILRLVQDFGKVPRGFLYEKVPASNTEIDQTATSTARCPLRNSLPRISNTPALS